MSTLDDSHRQAPRNPFRKPLPVKPPADLLDPSDWSVHCALVNAGLPPTSSRIDAFRAGMLYTLEVIRAARPK